MNSLRSLIVRLADRSRHTIAIAFVIALACAVPVFAANTFTDNNNGGVVTSSVTVDRPANLAAGDVMIASVSVLSDTVTVTTPAGWALTDNTLPRINTQSSPDTKLYSYWKVADSNDLLPASATYQWTLSGPAAAYAGIARYDDVVSVGGSPIANSATNPPANGNFGQDTTPDALPVNTTAPGQYVTAIFALADATGIDTGVSGWNALYNQARTSGTNPGRLAAYDFSQAAQGASTATTHSIDLAGNSQARYVSQTLALKTEPTKLAFSTSPTGGVVDGCLGPITVQTQNTSNTPTRPLTSTEVGLATNETGSFFSDSGCSTALTQGDRTIGTSATGFTFYYKPTARGSGSHQLTATDVAAVLTQAQQTQTVRFSQTIDFPAPPVTEETYGEHFEITVPTTASPSGLPVTVSATGGCTRSGTTVTMTSGTNDCVLTASQDGDADYAPVQVQHTVDALKRPITITADPQSKVYDDGTGGPDPALTYQFTGTLASGDVFGGSLTRGSTSQNAGTYPITQGTLSPGSTNNYDVTYIGANFVISKAILNVNASDRQKTYGATDPPFQWDYSGFVPGSGDTKNNSGIAGSASCSRVDGETVAGSPYTITCAPGNLTATNYSFATGATGNFTINPKQLDVDADPASKTYGNTDPAFTATLTGFITGENPTNAGVTGAATCTRPGAGTDEDVNIYTNAISCVPNTLAAANYTFTAGSPADFEVTPRTAHIAFAVADKVYDQGTTAQVTASLTNLVAADQDPGDVVIDGTPSAAFLTPSAGQNKPVDVTGITGISGPRAFNYTSVLDAATGNINPKPVDASFTAADKVYNGNTLTTVTSRSVDAADVLPGDSVALTGGTANFNNKNVGDPKTVTLTGASLSNSNYTIGTLATDSAKITKRNVTGHFTAADKDFDGTTAARITSRSLTNAIAGDAVSLTGGTATFGSASPGNDKTVTLTGASLGGSDAGNYNLASVATTTADIRREPGGSTPPPKDVKKDAENALGGPVQELTLDLHGLGYAFAPADQTGTLTVGKKAIKLFAIGGCDAPCTVAAKKTVVLIGSADGASAAAKKRKIQLGTQNLDLAAGEFGVIKLKKLTRKQRKAIKKAAKAKLVVKTTLTSAGESVTFKKKYKLKLKK